MVADQSEPRAVLRLCGVERDQHAVSVVCRSGFTDAPIKAAAERI
jgi:hypothetical protein